MKLLRRCLALALVGALAAPFVSVQASADEPVAPTPAQLEEAKRFFEQGTALRNASQFQAALEAFLKSRALAPRATNTLNAAVCLYELKRFDEAYEYFEDALSKYPDAQLTAAERESAKKTMADIETKVGRLDVSANIDGALVIDGRSRGKLPLLAPVRVLAGKHVVRVIRDGFSTFEQTVQVGERETVKLDAKLEALTAAGRLRIEAPPELDGAEVIIDGAAVGTLPWEGTLSPGTHIYLVSKGDLGAGPELAVVIVGQTVKRTITAKPLGPERRILTDPPTAALSIDGIALGKGRFQGRLPIGRHVVEAREDGYLSARVPLEVVANDSSDLPVKLAIDRTHPRWGVAAPKARLGLGLVFGWGFASSFGNDATAWCKDASPCDQKSAPSGPQAGIIGSYELPMGLGVFVEGGYWSLTRRLARGFDRSGIRYERDDEYRLSAWRVAAGVGYRIKLGPSYDLAGRLMVAGSGASARDESSGTASGGGVTLTTRTGGGVATAQGIMVDVSPEVAVGAWFGRHVRATVGVAMPIAILAGPKLSPGETQLVKSNCDANPGTIHCTAAGQKFDANDTPLSGAFVRFVPQLSAAYWF